MYSLFCNPYGSGGIAFSETISCPIKTMAFKREHHSTFKEYAAELATLLWDRIFDAEAMYVAHDDVSVPRQDDLRLQRAMIAVATRCGLQVNIVRLSDLQKAHDLFGKDVKLRTSAECAAGLGTMLKRSVFVGYALATQYTERDKLVRVNVYLIANQLSKLAYGQVDEDNLFGSTVDTSDVR